MKAATFLADCRKDFFDSPRFLFVLRLTAILLILRGFFGGAALLNNILIGGLSILMLSSPTWLKNRVSWFLLFGIMTWIVMNEWRLIDNTHYLIAYWILACALSVEAKDPDKPLAWNAKTLIGLTFTFAFLQKLFRGEYLNGEFFLNSFLLDARLKSLAVLAGGLTTQILEGNNALLQALNLFPGNTVSVTLQAGWPLKLLAILVSYWTLILEGLIGFCFLFAGRIKRMEIFDQKRDYPLMLFLCTTYAVASVPRFGSILAILGMAQCPLEKTSRRMAYFIIFLLLQFTLLVPALNENLTKMLG